MAATGHAVSAFRPLRTDHPEVSFAHEVCLPRRSPLSGCDACERACPVDALQAKRGHLVLDDACLGCGRCAAACPTGALRVRGFPRPEERPANEQERAESPLNIDCWRVPYEASPDHTLRVPCLGGLDAGTLAWLSVRHTGGTTLLDRGWCETCPAGCDETMAGATAQAQAREALLAAGVDEARLPRRAHLPLSADLAASDSIPDAGTEVRVSRRNLFRYMLGYAASASEQAADRRMDEATEHTPFPPQRRLTMAMTEATGNIPPAFQPRITMDTDRCADHQVCASLCPTDALLSVREEDRSGIDFDPSACISCGLCERVCPEQALTLHTDGGTSPVALTRHRHATCRECRRKFAGTTAELCPSCRKKYGLLAAGGHALLFGTRETQDTIEHTRCGGRKG